MSVEQIGTVYVDSERLPAKPVCVELGANTGRFAIAFLERFGGRVIAYEPGRIADTIPERPGLEVRRDAISNTCGPISFCECPEQSQTSSVHTRTPSRGQAEFVNVHAVSLDIALRKLDWIDCLNMDIEGAEWNVLDSAAIRHLRKVDQICIEFHTEFAGGRKLMDVLEELSSRAWFNLSVFDAGSTRPIVYGVKRKMSPRRPTNQWLRFLLHSRHFESVLNLGCGSDSDLEEGCYSDYIHADRIVKADVQAGPGIDVVAPAEDLPFDDDSFDFVFANWVIYKTDLPRSLAEIARVLRPGGQVMLSYGHEDINFVTAIRATLRSMFKIIDSFEMGYVAKRAVRRAEAVFGTLRADAAQCFGSYDTEPVLVVVAHWDDEALSLGGFLEAGCPAAVVCATHRDQEPTYQAVFEQIGKDVGFEAVTLDIRQRERALDVENEDRHDYCRTVKRVTLDRAAIEPELRKTLGDLSRFKTVITHSENGDYGSHPSHKELARTVQEIFGQTANVWSFNAKAGTVCRPFTPEQVDRKWELIRRYKPGHKRSDVFATEYFIRLRGAG